MLHLLRRAGIRTTTFDYTTAFESFPSIKERLTAKIIALAARENYIVVGHSLGGVLLRATLNSLPASTIRPQHVFLLGSPIQPSRLAAVLKKNIIFRVLAGDCGQLLSSPERMAEVGALAEPVTSVIGVRGIAITQKYFDKEANDGVVSVAEVSAHWILNQVQLPVIHALLPLSRCVAEIIIENVTENAG